MCHGLNAIIKLYANLPLHPYTLKFKMPKQKGTNQKPTGLQRLNKNGIIANIKERQHPLAKHKAPGAL